MVNCEWLKPISFEVFIKTNQQETNTLGLLQRQRETRNEKRETKNEKQITPPSPSSSQILFHIPHWRLTVPLSLYYILTLPAKI